MALEYADSFDTYTAVQIVRRYPLSIGSISMSTGVSGSGQCLYETNGFNAYLVVPVTQRNEYYGGCDIWAYSFGGGYGPLIDIRDISGTLIGTIGTAATGVVTTSWGNSSTGVVVDSVWFNLVFHIVISATVGVITVKIDGNTVINLTGQNTGSANIGSFRLCGANSAQEKYDNFWIFNTLGTHSNGFPIGRIAVQSLMPTADGAYTDWIPNSGSNHYNRVSEAQADDDTTYNSTVTAGNKDSYGIDAISGSPAHIHGVIVTAITRKTDVNSKNYQVFSKSGATETYSPDIATALTYASSTQNGAASLLHTDDPNTGVEWTQANLNAIEVGAKVTL